MQIKYVETKQSCSKSVVKHSCKTDEINIVW